MRHEERVLGQGEQDIFTCQMCGKEFASEEALQNHAQQCEEQEHKPEIAFLMQCD